MRARQYLRLACLLLPALVWQPTAIAAPALTPLTAGFGGAWVGVLEYRDFSTDAQAFLPTWLTMTPSADGSSVALAYLYDDGPAKVVREQATLTFDNTVNTATLKTGDHVDLYEVHGLSIFQKDGRGILTFTGTGTENGKPVYTRVLLTLERNRYTWRRETRPQDGSEVFRLRDAYSFTREKPPSS